MEARARGGSGGVGVAATHTRLAALLNRADEMEAAINGGGGAAAGGRGNAGDDDDDEGGGSDVFELGGCIHGGEKEERDK